METDNGMSEQYPDARTARSAVRDAQTRMAARLRSPWWVHGLRALSIGLVVFGVTGQPTGAGFLTPLGVVALIALARWRTRSVGFSRANPERWAFLLTGAPWSIVIIVITAAAMALLVFAPHLALLPHVGIAAAVAVLAGLLGPLADRAGRRRLVDDLPMRADA